MLSGVEYVKCFSRAESFWSDSSSLSVREMRKRNRIEHIFVDVNSG